MYGPPPFTTLWMVPVFGLSSFTCHPSVKRMFPFLPGKAAWVARGANTAATNKAASRTKRETERERIPMKPRRKRKVPLGQPFSKHFQQEASAT